MPSCFWINETALNIRFLILFFTNVLKYIYKANSSCQVTAKRVNTGWQVYAMNSERCGKVAYPKEMWFNSIWQGYIIIIYYHVVSELELMFMHA